ncbi:hypothetical protein FHG87_021620 [Trinorchestia longiramus]|nr:hypothetical protein FHG87_021620 [Trinorchestia longiramus]
MSGNVSMDAIRALLQNSIFDVSFVKDLINKGLFTAQDVVKFLTCEAINIQGLRALVQSGVISVDTIKRFFLLALCPFQFQLRSRPPLVEGKCK